MATVTSAARLDELAAKLEMIQTEIRELRAHQESADPHSGPAPDSDAATKNEALSRRGLLHKSAAVVVGGVALAAGNSVLNPRPAKAVNELIMGVNNFAGNAQTDLVSTDANRAFAGRNNSSGIGLYGYSLDGIGVYGYSEHFEAVVGESTAIGHSSLKGLKTYDKTGPAVKGENSNSANGYAAVYGLTNGTGPAVYGEGTAQGNGTSGVARGTGSGVYGQSDNGRGGRFKGKKAQIRLEPATTTTHPASGDAGDIYLDKSKRLWLCKGGTVWVKILTS